MNAVAYATRYHPEWFWWGAQHTRKWRANVRENLIGKFLATDPHCRTTFLLAAPIAEPAKHSTLEADAHVFEYMPLMPPPSTFDTELHRLLK